MVWGVAVSAVRATFRGALWAIAAHWLLVPSRSLRSRLPGFRSSCQVWMGGLWAVLLSLRTAVLGVRAIVRGWALWAATMPLPLSLPPLLLLLLRLLLLLVVAVSRVTHLTLHLHTVRAP